MRVPLAEYRPDAADTDISVATVARNVMVGGSPAGSGGPLFYLPFRALLALTTATAAIGTPLGYILCQDAAGDYTLIMAANDGSVDRIYSYESGTWTDRSYTGGYAAADTNSGWHFAQYGDNIIAVSGSSNAVQVGLLSNLSGGFSAIVGNGSTAPPRARFVKVIGEFVVLTGLADFPTSAQWSGIGDSAEWRIGTDGCDRQEFPDGGLTTGVTGSEYGLIFQEKSIRRMVFSPGSPYAFSFQRASESLGCAAPNSITEADGRHFWLAQGGFWMEYGGQIVPIGEEKVNRTFFADIDTTSISHVLGCADPVKPVVYFAYSSLSQSTVTTRDKILAYNYQIGAWTTIETTVSYICQVAQVAQSIDAAPLATMALEDIPYSLDSAAYRGGQPVFGGFTTGYLVGQFAGDPLEATIESGSAQIGQPNRAFVRKVAPLIDTSGARVNVATRHTVFGTETWRTERAPSAKTGYGHFDCSGRFHRVRMRIPSGTSWTKATGFEVDAVAENGD